MKPILRLTIALSVCLFLSAAEKYTGPRPSKPDIPYLQHADRLVETEAGQAAEETRKDDKIAKVPGATSPARTPLAEPIFLFDSEKIAPESLELYRMDVRNGAREVVFGRKKGPRQYRLMVTRLSEKLYRIEVNEGMGLEDGEYALSPKDSSQVFCFEVY
jgi:hypothetical protein